MDVRVSDETAVAIERLVRERDLADAQSVVEAAVALIEDSQPAISEYSLARIQSALKSLARNGGHLPTPELVEDIKRCGRERLRASNPA